MVLGNRVGSKRLACFPNKQGKLCHLFQDKYYWSGRAITPQCVQASQSEGLAAMFIQIKVLFYYKGKVSVFQGIDPADRSKMGQKKILYITCLFRRNERLRQEGLGNANVKSIRIQTSWFSQRPHRFPGSPDCTGPDGLCGPICSQPHIQPAPCSQLRRAGEAVPASFWASTNAPPSQRSVNIK